MFKIYLYLLLVLLLFFLCLLVRSMLRTWRTNFWEETEGIVTESKLFNLGLVSLGIGSGGGSNVPKYGASIEYQYFVKGELFQSKRVVFFEILTSTSKLSIEKILSRYPIQKPIKVYYDPKDPSEAVLEHGFNIKILFSCVALSVFIGVIIYAITLKG